MVPLNTQVSNLLLRGCRWDWCQDIFYIVFWYSAHPMMALHLVPLWQPIYPLWFGTWSNYCTKFPKISQICMLWLWSIIGSGGTLNLTQSKPILVNFIFCLTHELPIFWGQYTLKDFCFKNISVQTFQKGTGKWCNFGCYLRE